MTGTEIYKRTPAYESEAETIRLHAPQWKLLLAYDGQRSLAEVALSVEVAFSDALPLTDKFLGHGWIEEQPITLNQYLKRTGAANVSAVGSAVTPAVVLHEPKPETATPPATLASAVMEEAVPAFRAAEATPAAPPVPVASPVPTAPSLVSAMRPASPPPLVPPPLTPSSLTPPSIKAPPLRPPQVSSAPPVPPLIAISPPTPAPVPVTVAPPVNTVRGPMRLKAVVDYIVSQVGNNSLGQLVVYRVFLRVPPQLLQAEDIASVHLVNDQSVVKTDELKKAIEASVMEVLKRSLPESVFAAA